MDSISFVVKCHISRVGFFTDEENEQEVADLESLLKENGYKSVRVEVE